MAMNAARYRILPPFRGRLHDSVSDAVARCQFAGMAGSCLLNRAHRTLGAFSDD
jgi:hypothetical protein